MISKLSKKVVIILIDKAIINDTEDELYRYGLFMLISQTLYFILSLIFGVILNIVLESVVFYVAFQFIRTSAGGIHASSELKCEVATTLSLLLCLGIVKLCDLYNFKLVILILMLVATVLIFLLCPLDTPEKPLTIKEKKYFREKSWIIVLIILTIIGLSMCFKINTLMYPCCMSLILESILLFLGKIKETRKKNG
jgi:accessory gene regulator B